MLTLKEARVAVEAACLFAENQYDKFMASGQGLANFDPDRERRDELAAGWAWRLISERGRTASVSPEDKIHMLTSGLRLADIEQVERMIRMTCRQPKPNAATGQKPGAVQQPVLDEGILFNRAGDVAEVGVMAGITMTPSVFKHLDRIMVKANAALAFKRAGMVPESLKDTLEIAAKADPSRLDDADDRAINRALIDGGYRPYTIPQRQEATPPSPEPPVVPAAPVTGDTTSSLASTLSAAPAPSPQPPVVATAPAPQPAVIAPATAPQPAVVAPAPAPQQAFVALAKTGTFAEDASSNEPSTPLTANAAASSGSSPLIVSEAANPQEVSAPPQLRSPGALVGVADAIRADKAEPAAAALEPVIPPSRTRPVQAPDFSAVLGSDPNKAILFKPLPPPSATVAEVLPFYFAHRGETLKQGGRDSITGAVRFLHLVFGNVSLADIQRDDGEKFCAIAGLVPARYADDTLALDAKGKPRGLPDIIQIGISGNLPKLALRTIEKHCSNLRGLWKWGARNGLTAENLANPFALGKADIKAFAGTSAKQSQARKAWDSEALSKYLTGPVHLGCAGTRSRFKPGKLVVRDALYWAIPILYLCMMRRGELFQLQVKHVRQWTATDGSRRWYFDLTDLSLKLKGKAASLRPSASYRQVPIHSSIIELGFIRDHVEGRAPEERLFPELKPMKGDDYGHYVGNRLREYAKQLEVFEKLMDTHSLRRTANSALFNQLASPMVRAQLLGHSSGGSSRSTGDSTLIKQLIEQLAAAFATDGSSVQGAANEGRGEIRHEVLNQLLGQHTTEGQRETMQEKHYLEDMPLQIRSDVIELLQLPIDIGQLNTAWNGAAKRISVRSPPVAKRNGLKRPQANNGGVSRCVKPAADKAQASSWSRHKMR
ncbi:hypothetical protein [Phreatobacter sp.]|uniref:hypothetical protein n=1 Tax=Phreatobacter sp. TaxID=1966341 RepID=UPI0025D46E32|nr:hypothetical protein [Phreatobacter sp.]